MDFIYSASHLISEKKVNYAFSFGSLVVALRIYVGHDSNVRLSISYYTTILYYMRLAVLAAILLV